MKNNCILENEENKEKSENPIKIPEVKENSKKKETPYEFHIDGYNDEENLWFFYFFVFN